MKGARLKTTVIALLLAFTFFLSVPALSIEDPWDVDIIGGESLVKPGDGVAGDGSGTVADTSSNLETPDGGAVDDPGDVPGSGWWENTLVTMSYKLVETLSPSSFKRLR